MSRATPQMRIFAERLIAYEGLGKNSGAIKGATAFRVLTKLRPQLAILMGNGGFRALFSRILPRAGMEVPWLRAVHVKADGALEGLEELESQVNPKQIAEGGVVLLTELLGSLVGFIGENLTLRLVLEIWPEVPLDDLDFGNGGNHEKTK